MSEFFTQSRGNLSFRCLRFSPALVAALTIAVGSFMALPASAQVEYIGNIFLPDHTNLIRSSTSPVDRTNPSYNPNANDTTLLFTQGEVFQLNIYGNAASFFPLAIPWSQYAISPPPRSLSVDYNRGLDSVGTREDPQDRFVLLSINRNSLTTYDFTKRVYLTGAPMNTVTSAERKALSVGHGYAVMVSTSNQLWTSPLTSTAFNYNSPTRSETWPVLPSNNGNHVLYFNYEPPAVFTNIATVSNDPASLQFTNLTEVAFAPEHLGGLLYALDWGTQKVKAFDVADPTGNYFRYSFDLPIDFTLTNTTGLGFTINDEGRMLLSNGEGGLAMMSLTGELLATVTPPEDQKWGINVNAPDDSGAFPNLGDTLAHYITYNSKGDIFVVDGLHGMHWYKDITPVPEPSTWALLGLGAVVVFWQVRRRLLAKV